MAGFPRTLKCVAIIPAGVNSGQPNSSPNKISKGEVGSEISKKSYFAVLNEREVKNLIKLKDKIKVIQGLKE